MATLVVLDGVCSGRAACRYLGPAALPATGAAGRAHA